ncbi:hypothetical protein OEZ86_011005 [Tetradesmus obliquus]|nr:hypothetical protein OEZ86_011005 [Tetradesmus obliquus]
MADRSQPSVRKIAQKFNQNPFKLDPSPPGSEAASQAEAGALLGAEDDKGTLDQQLHSPDQPGTSTKQQASSQTSAQTTPLNFGSQASVRNFAGALNASPASLDLMLLHAAEGGSGRRRWYTAEGVSGAAQVGFLGPAYLLYLLQPKLAACSTQLLLTASPLHRLGQIDDAGALLHDWAGGSSGESQLALLAYARQLAGHLGEYGVAAAAVDVGILREQPLAGSLLRKLPPLPQLLALLLPASSDSARLLAGVAGELLTAKAAAADTAAARPVATAAAADEMEELAAGAAGQQQQRQQQQGEGGSIGPVEEAAEQDAMGGGALSAQGTEFSESVGESSDSAAGAGVEAGTAGATEGGVDEGTSRASGTAGFDQKRRAAAAAAEHPAGALSDDWEVQQGEVQHDEVWRQGDQAGTAAAGSDNAAAGADVLDVAAPEASVASSAVNAAAVGGSEGLLEGAGRVAGAAAGGLQKGAAEAGMEQQQVPGGGAAAAVNGGGGSGAGVATGKSFRYISRGLLATPLLTSLDHAGRTSWVTRALSSLTHPAYTLASSSIVYACLLLDWPARAWLLGPAGAATGWAEAVLGSRAAKVMERLQRAVPGVQGVAAVSGGSAAGDSGWGRANAAHGGVEWAEVSPGGLVGSEVVGQQLWQLVNEEAGRA